MGSEGPRRRLDHPTGVRPRALRSVTSAWCWRHARH
jgi:hypothetical protein